MDPPYCYTWKWYEAPIANRAQPVVASGRLFVGSMDGVLYARDASTGAPLWQFRTTGPIRHSPAVQGSTVVTGSHDGFTYALDVATGALIWKTQTGPSATAPLVNPATGRVYVGATSGVLTALDLGSGNELWQYDAGAPILTTPALSGDGTTVFVGSEAIQAIALDAATGAQRWRQTLPGQSMADRSPVVVGSSVIYRTQPIDHFHLLLHEGDDVMDQAGTVNPDWAADWAGVRPRIINYLTSQTWKQTMFVLDSSSGASRGVVPMLYTYGNNDNPAPPVMRGTEVYVPYRARHGIQTDGNSVHVTSRYDGELGRFDPATLDFVGLRQSNYPNFSYEFRLTSDEPASLTVGGNIVFVDNWERLGGINLQSGALVHVGAVSNDWPECYAQCGPGTNNPFFPMSGSGAAYPFPSPRVTEGHQRPGAIIANNMIYWRVIEAGLGAISRRVGTSCPAPRVWQGSAAVPGSPDGVRMVASASSARPFSDYVMLDLTTPVADPPADLVNRLRSEVRDLVSAGNHLMPFYLQRGHSKSQVWPNKTTSPPGPPKIEYNSEGNAYWYDPGELLYTVALSYPYLDAQLQADLKAYMASEFQRYPPLSDLPWSGMPWLKTGVARERYAVPFRNSLNNWPPPAASIQAIYALWLWSKNTNDWTYAQSKWANAKSLFTARRSSMNYYADIAGAIGYARMASRFNDSAAVTDGTAAALAAMQAGLAFDTFRTQAESEYPDALDFTTGWYMPVFYGMTPEVGLYLREHLGNRAVDYVHSKERGNGLRWWYLTRVGSHADVGESSYVTPIAGWSHFLAQAHIVGASRSTLRGWLDRPWGRGDLYSIQRLVATIQAR